MDTPASDQPTRCVIGRHTPDQQVQQTEGVSFGVARGQSLNAVRISCAVGSVGVVARFHRREDPLLARRHTLAASRTDLD